MLMLGLWRRLWPQWGQTLRFLIVGLFLVFLALFFFWHLGSMTPGLGPDEYRSRQNSHDIGQIINRGVDAPYYLTQNGLVALFDDEALGLRLASVFVGLVIFGFLYLLLRAWFGRVVALFASLIFITTPWVIITARTATPNIMLLWPVVVMSCFVLMSRSKQRVGLRWLLFCITAGLSLYTPGLVWLFLAGLLLAGRSFAKLLSRQSVTYAVTGLILLILLASPLVLALFTEPSRIRQLFLIPTNLQPASETLKSIGWSAASFFWSTRSSVDIGIGRLPLLNILQIVLVIFGGYALSSKARHIILALMGLLLFSVLAAGINDNPHLLLLGLPAFAVFVAAGLRYLYIEWRRVFPLNPFAYGLAIGLMALVVSVHLLYSARYSLVAWPATSETKNTYVLK